MLQFILGTFFGSFVAFVAVAVISTNKIDDEPMPPNPTPDSKEAGASDARK